jgi:chromosome segregation ATPase
VYLIDSVRSERDSAILDPNREMREKYSFQDRYRHLAMEKQHATEELGRISKALGDEKSERSRLQQDLTRKESDVREMSKELVSDKMNAAALQKSLEAQIKELGKELTATEDEAAVTEKLLEYKVEQVEDMKLQL